MAVPSLARPTSIRRLAKRVLPEGRRPRRLWIGPARGVTLNIDFHRGETSLYLGLYEQELHRHFRSMCRPGDRAFDLGGHRGHTALLIANLTRAAVVTVEADARCAEELRANCALNPALGPVHVVQSMVSATAGPDRVTVDELADRWFVPDVVKLDIEGAEADALRGAPRVLATKPALIIEVHGEAVEEEVLELLREAGYPAPLVVNPRRWLPDHRPLGHNRWLVATSGLRPGR